MAVCTVRRLVPPVDFCVRYSGVNVMLLVAPFWVMSVRPQNVLSLI